MARNAQKLNDVAQLIQNESKVDVKTIVFDFAKLGSDEQVKSLKTLLDEVTNDISILVNNVGVLNMQRLNEVDINTIIESVSVNCCAQTFMTHFLLPRLLSRTSSKQVRSAIINLSSKASYKTRGRMALYCSTKLFNRSLSYCLSAAHQD